MTTNTPLVALVPQTGTRRITVTAVATGTTLGEVYLDDRLRWVAALPSGDTLLDDDFASIRFATGTAAARALYDAARAQDETDEYESDDAPCTVCGRPVPDERHGWTCSDACAERWERGEQAPRVPARRIDLNTASAERVAAEVIGRTIRTTVNVEDGRGWWKRAHRTGTVERVENGRTVVRFDDGTWTYGPSGRVTVR